MSQNRNNSIFIDGRKWLIGYRIPVALAFRDGPAGLTLIPANFGAKLTKCRERRDFNKSEAALKTGK